MGQKLKSNLELIFIWNISADYESTPMILRSEEDEEVDIVTDTDEDDAQQHFIAYQHQQQQRNSKLSRADCMKKLQTCKSPE